MKVVLINGSPRGEGNTYLALSEVANVLEADGIQTKIISIGAKAVQGCVACNKCREQPGRCVFQDKLYNTVLEEIEQADGLIVGSPTYYAGPNGSLCALLDRVFYSAGRYLRNKPGAAVAVCRRGGASASLDRLNKYFVINNMPIAPSQYWNIIHGWAPGEVLQDAEGLQTMRTLGRNMSWLMRSLQSNPLPTPSDEPRQVTNFIR